MQPREIPEGIMGATSPTAIAAGLGVRISGSAIDQVALPSASSDPFFGVVHNPIPAGGYGSVATRGMKVALSGAAIARGAEVECGVDGRFVTRTTGRGVGIANTAATDADEEFELYLYGLGGTINSGVGATQERKVTIGVADLNDADGSEDENIGLALPDRAMVLGVSFSGFTPFAGGSVSQLLVDIGDATDIDAIRDGVNVSAAAVDGQPSAQPLGIAPNKYYPTATQLIARFLATGGNLADLTSGAITIRVQFVVLAA